MFSKFRGFYSIEQLYNEGFSCIPNENGIYIVMKPEDMEVEFTAGTTAINTFNGRSMLYDPDILLTQYEKSD